jgi:IS5 family transposase
MRMTHNAQMNFQDLRPQWTKAKELKGMNTILEENAQVFEIAAPDFETKKGGRAGRPGMTVEQVVRCAIVKQWEQLDYRDLEDRIDDSERLRSFCRFGDGKVPRYRTLQDNIKRLSTETWEQILRVLVQYAQRQGVDNGKHVRIDCTAVESNIHAPNDAWLMKDVAKVLTRTQVGARKNLGEYVEVYPNRMRAIGKRVFSISNARTDEKRQPLYRQLITLTEEVMRHSRALLESLDKAGVDDVDDALMLNVYKGELRKHIGYGEQIIDVARRRVLQGEKVPASEKLVSIFEPHTDIIQKGARKTVFGHKICLGAGRSGLIFDCGIFQGNPTDTTLFSDTLDRLTDVLGAVPTHVCADDGFASLKNGNAAKDKGVEQVAFGGKLKTELLRWVDSVRVQKQLRRFRAGIEGIISAVKRAFGLGRCTWSGWEGFKQYVLSAIVAWNLQVMARHALKSAT